MSHNDNWRAVLIIFPQSKGTDSSINMSYSKIDCVTMSNASKNMIMRSSQESTKAETRTRSGWISCRPERLGIDTQ